jgi:uncharacterized membrane protein YuzA (DUF378 family)
MDEMSDEEARRLIDLPTLLLVLFGGIYVGLMGAFQIDILQMALGGVGARLIQAAIGLSAIWQITRQRFI